MGIRDKLSSGVSADAILLTFIKLVTTALGLATTRLLSEYLSVHDYGTYSQIMLVVSTIASVTIFGMMDGVNYFYAGKNEEDEKESYVATIFALQCVISAVAGLVVMIMNRNICGYFGNEDIGIYLIFAAILPFLQNILGMSQVLFVSIGKARLLAYRNLAISTIRMISVFIVVFAVRSILVILITTLVIDIGQIAFFWIILRKNSCRLNWRKVHIKYFGDVIHYCTPMAIFLIINTLNRDIDKYLVSAMTDTETLAMYSNASKQLPFDIIMASFCTVLVPYITRYISNKNKEKAAELYKLFIEIAYVSTGILCFAALSASPQLMKLLYSNKYTDGLAIFCVYIFVDLFRFTNITLVLSAAGRTKRLMILGVGSLAFNALLNIVFYRVMGIIGPAVATLVVIVITGVIMLSFSASILETRLSKLFDLKYLIVFVLESVALTFALSKLREYLHGMNIHYFAILVIVAGIYGITMLLLNGKRLLSDLYRVNRVGYDE